MPAPDSAMHYRGYTTDSRSSFRFRCCPSRCCRSSFRFRYCPSRCCRSSFRFRYFPSRRCCSSFRFRYCPSRCCCSSFCFRSCPSRRCCSSFRFRCCCCCHSGPDPADSAGRSDPGCFDFRLFHSASSFSSLHRCRSDPC